jgi:nitroreductase
MIKNETVKSILARRSYKAFKSDPISDDILETIIEAGKHAPTGMNRQAWHFTVVKSEEGRKMFMSAMREMLNRRGPGRPNVPPAQSPGTIIIADEEFRGAPVLIIVSGEPLMDITRADCVLATGNMYTAAASFGVMSGWSHITTHEFFSDPKVKRQFKIPEGYEVYSASFFGYPLGEAKDRGPRKEGTVTIL